MALCLLYRCGEILVLCVVLVLNTGLTLKLSGNRTSQSSTHTNNGGVFLSSSLAVDGDRETNSRTGSNGHQWWMVDLDAVHCLTKITLVNHKNPNIARELKDAVVRAGLSSDYSQNTMIGSAVTADQAQARAEIDFIPDLTATARYVSVDLSGKHLSLAEVIVEELMSTTKTSTPVLPLTGRLSRQSSTYQDDIIGDWNASRAVDGEIQYTPPYCSRTNAETNPWWKVDLMFKYCVGKVAIKNRNTSNADVKLRLQGAVVRAGISDFHTNNTVCGAPVTSEQALSDDWIDVTCNPPVLARYVSVDIPGVTTLTLCEVMVFTCDQPADFILVTNPALMGPTGDNDATMTVFKGPNDVSAGILFGRQVRTGGSTDGLPAGSSVAADPAVGCAATLVYQLPEEGGINRTGVFYSEATKNDVNTRIQTVILSKDDNVHTRPSQRTQTASIGESVMLQMIDVSSPNSDYRWRHNGADIIESWNGQLSVSIASVDVTNGVYSCFVDGQEHQQHHGFMRLIVRGCPAGMWGPPSCQNTCRRCYNGGICDDKTGSCICAPGFSGKSCELVHGRHVFGKNASHGCSDNADQHNAACRGRLFCLPDPYGCSCAAGYTGLECTQECEAGKYGADCKQTCHCASGGTCLKDTGECNGGCEMPYFGGNCQCSAENAVLGLRVASGDPYQLFVTWQPDPCASGYTLQYELTNRGQCEEIVSPQRVSVSDTLDKQTDHYFITGLESRSSYTIYIRPQYDTQGPEVTASGITLRRNDPTSVSPLVVNARHSGNVTLSWRPVFCADMYVVQYALINREGCETIDQVTYSMHCMCSGDTSMITLSSLSPFSLYNVRVKAYVDNDYGPEVTTNVTTHTAVPTKPPAEVSVTSVGQRNLTFMWSEPPCGGRGGNITGYTYMLTFKGSPNEGLNQSPSSATSVTFDNLIPFTEYGFQVAANTSAGIGPYNPKVTARTNEAVPTVPLNVRIQDVDNVSITLEWSEPNPPHGVITRYSVQYWRSGDSNNVIVDANVTQLIHRIVHLETNATYRIQVQAATSVGAGPWSETVNATTRIGVPGPVQNLRSRDVTDTSVTLEWSPPIKQRGRIIRYIVESRVLDKPYQPAFTVEDTYSRNEVDNAPFVENKLEPGTKYEYRVKAENVKFVGEANVLEVYTKPKTDLPSPPPATLHQDGITDTTVTINLPISFPGDTYVESYVVEVKKSSLSAKREILIPRLFEDSPEAYIAAEFSKNNVSDIFVVGDAGIYGGYYNAPLQKGALYDIRVGSVSKGNETEATVAFSDAFTVKVEKTQNSSFPVGGLVAAFVVILIMCLVLIVVYRRKRRRKENSPDTDKVIHSAGLSLEEQTGNFDETSSNDYNDNDEVESSPSSTRKPELLPKPRQTKVPVQPAPANYKQDTFVQPHDVRVDELEKYIRMKESAGDNGFKADYKTLPDKQLHPWTVAQKPENRAKNRYVNVVAYDYSRVVLEPQENDPHSDYINACYIDGYLKTDKYIASQGPNKASIQDMWRMVWQLNVDKIVMLTNPVENGKVKCLQYWADSGSATYSNIVVTKVKEEVFLDYTIRILCIHQVGSEDCSRLVKQFHYTTWPDMKPPEHPAPLLNFMRVVNAENSQGRTVIHCSAGVGRTGTYIALDSLLEQMKVEGRVNVLGFIYRMRQKRIKMVQTSEQYKFLFDALLVASLTGDTTYQTTDLRNRLTALKRKEKGSEDTGLEKQFQTMCKLSVASSMGTTSGQLPKNVDKNRFPDFVPTDRARPYLMTKVKEDDTDYINATFLPGYRRKNMYIGTQMPMPNTEADIWRLVYCQRVTRIVMLNSLDTDDETVCRYWPEQGGTEFGPLVVELLQTKEYRGVTERTFSLRSKKAKTEPASTVTQLQCRDWPTDEEVPNSFEGLLTLMDLTQTASEDERPIVVHCMDGLGCTAVYCTLMSLLEQFKAEKAIDVFQAAHRLRMVNANMMYSAAHYAMCYDAFQAYLDSTSIYENVTVPKENE